MKLLIQAQGVLQKGLHKAGKEGPTVRLHCSGTRLDLTGDKVLDEALQYWVNLANAGKVMLLDQHGAAFPCGQSFFGEIIEQPATTDLDGNSTPASRELYIEFVMDTSHPMTNTILSQLGNGYEAQCSVGITTPPGVPVRQIAYDPEEGKAVGMIARGELEHVAFTRPNDAAYQYADVESYTMKSLDSVRVELPKIWSKKMKADHKKALEEASKAREEAVKKMQEPGAKGDLDMTRKAVIQRARAGAQMAKDLYDDPAASPEDLRAMLAHLMAENDLDAQALEQYEETAESPEEDAMEIENAKPTEDKAVPVEAPSAKPAVAAPVVAKDVPADAPAGVPATAKDVGEMAMPVAPEGGGHQAMADHHAAMAKYHLAMCKAEEPEAAPADDKPADVAEGKPVEKDGETMAKEGEVMAKDDAVMTKEIKALVENYNTLRKDFDGANKLIKEQGDLLQKFRKIPDLESAPARNNMPPSQGGSALLKSLNASAKDTVSRGLTMEAIIDAIGGAADDSGAV